MKPRVRITLRLSPSLKRAAEDFAAKDGVSVSRYIAQALAEKIGSSGAAEFFAERGKNCNPEHAIAFLGTRLQKNGMR